MQSPLDLFGLTIAGMQWISFLVDLAFRSSLILLVAWLITMALHRSSAATRHRVWTAAFILVLLVPLSQMVVPHVSFPVIPSVQHYYPAVANGGELSIVRRSTDWSTELGALVAVSWPAVAFMLWIGGAIYLFTRTALGIGVVQWLSLGDSKSRFSHHKLDLFADICADLNLQRPVLLLRRDKVRIPMTAGALRPMIILPEEAEDWSDARFRSVLLHELAHVKRWDFLTKQIATLAKIICWFNPLVWIAARHMQAEMETACDDLVLQRGIKASDYALDLADIVRRFGNKLGLLAGGGVAMAGSRNGLPKRLQRILDPEIERRPLQGKAAFALTAVLMLFALPAFVLQPFFQPKPCSYYYKYKKKQYIRDAHTVKRMLEDAVNAFPEWSTRLTQQPAGLDKNRQANAKPAISSCSSKTTSRES